MSGQKTLTVIQHSDLLFLMMEHQYTFEELCQLFPDRVGENTHPNWGTAIYIADENGLPIMLDEYWDTSG